MCAFPAGDMDAARKWEEQAQQLQNLLTSQVIGAATAHSLLLVGPAGIGKTHAIVSAALRRLEHGGFPGRLWRRLWQSRALGSYAVK